MQGQHGNNFIQFLAVGFFAIAFGLVLGVSNVRAKSYDSSYWGKFGEPTVLDANESDLNLDQVNAVRKSYMGAHGRSLCTLDDVELYPDYKYPSCWYNSEIGRFSDYGNIWEPSDGRRAGFLGAAAEARTIPTLHPRVFLELKPLEGGGYSLGFRSLDNSDLEIVDQYAGGPIFYNWAGTPAAALVNELGDYWPVTDNMVATTIWFGRGGRYVLLADESTGAVSRIDLFTFKVLTARYTENDSDQRFATFDITNDGKKVVVNVLGDAPRLLHLDMCLGGGEEAYVTEALVCPAVNLSGAVDTFEPLSHGRLEFAHFKEDYIIEMYAEIDFNGDSPYYGKLYMYAPGTWHPDRRYIALGDSFASGEGAGNYYAGTNVRSGNLCHLSRRSYPYLIKAQTSSVESVRSVACSGAKMRHINARLEFVDNSREPREWATNQYSMRDEDPLLAEWTPGRFRQIEYFDKQYAPGIVTISIGGNDMGFGHILEQCVDPRKLKTCFKDERERSMLIGQIDSQLDKLVDVYTDIRRGAALGANVYVIGYPEVIKPGGKCGVNVLLNKEEIQFVDTITKYINGVVKTAATKAEVRYIDVSRAFYGHRLCESGQPAMNGATLNGWIERRFISPESYHPTAFGHELLAEEITRQSESFTLKNPRRSPYAYILSVQEMVEMGLFATEYAATRAGMLFYYGPLQGSVIAKSENRDVSLLGALYGLLPNSVFEVWLNSDPVYLGSFVSNEAGDLSFSFAVPDSVEEGVHALRIIGKGVDGEDREVRAAIYAAHSYEDWDGDGILNDRQGCPYFINEPISGAENMAWCGLSSFQNTSGETEQRMSEGEAASLAATGTSLHLVGILSASICLVSVRTTWVLLKIRRVRKGSI